MFDVLSCVYYESLFWSFIKFHVHVLPLQLHKEPCSFDPYQVLRHL